MPHDIDTHSNRIESRIKGPESTTSSKATKNEDDIAAAAAAVEHMADGQATVDKKQTMQLAYNVVCSVRQPKLIYRLNVIEL